MSEELSPEEVVQLLNEWFFEATQAINCHGGLVDKFVGDAVMALFGPPEVRDDANAIRAAIDMVDALYQPATSCNTWGVHFVLRLPADIRISLKKRGGGRHRTES